MVAIEKGEIEVPPHRIHRHKILKAKVSRTKISQGFAKILSFL